MPERYPTFRAPGVIPHQLRQPVDL